MSLRGPTLPEPPPDGWARDKCINHLLSTSSSVHSIGWASKIVRTPRTRTPDLTRLAELGRVKALRNAGQHPGLGHDEPRDCAPGRPVPLH